MLKTVDLRRLLFHHALALQFLHLRVALREQEGGTSGRVESAFRSKASLDVLRVT